MLPFIPGMIGSRKKGDELRDIYSGVEPVLFTPADGGKWALLPSKEAASKNGVPTGASSTKATPKMQPFMDRKQRSGNTTRSSIPYATCGTRITSRKSTTPGGNIVFP